MVRMKYPTGTPPIVKVLDRAVLAGECWEFNGYRDKFGYGHVKSPTGNHLAHRVTFEYFIHEVPAELELDHLCRNPSCCNPWHLDPVTHAVNCQRGRAGYAPDDRCKHGHDLSDSANVYTHTAGRNGRKCKPCALRNSRARHQRMKENQP